MSEDMTTTTVGEGSPLPQTEMTQTTPAQETTNATVGEGLAPPETVEKTPSVTPSRATSLMEGGLETLYQTLRSALDVLAPSATVTDRFPAVEFSVVSLQPTITFGIKGVKIYPQFDTIDQNPPKIPCRVTVGLDIFVPKGQSSLTAYTLLMQASQALYATAQVEGIAVGELAYDQKLRHFHLPVTVTAPLVEEVLPA